MPWTSWGVPPVRLASETSGSLHERSQEVYVDLMKAMEMPYQKQQAMHFWCHQHQR